MIVGNVIGVYDGKVIEAEPWCQTFLRTTWDAPRFLIRRPRRSPGAWPPRRRYPYDHAVQGL